MFIKLTPFEGDDYIINTNNIRSVTQVTTPEWVAKKWNWKKQKVVILTMYEQTKEGNPHQLMCTDSFTQVSKKLINEPVQSTRITKRTKVNAGS